MQRITKKPANQGSSPGGGISSAAHFVRLRCRSQCLMYVPEGLLNITQKVMLETQQKSRTNAPS
jgi:hypothetical protein